MKRIASIVLAMTMVVNCLTGCGFASLYGGKGNVFKIDSVMDFAKFINRVGLGETGLNARLDVDLDLSAAFGPGVADWAPIQSYNGTFDGNGHTIKGIYMDDEAAEYAGFFKSVSKDGVVKNLGLESVDISGSKYVGGIAAVNLGTIQNCWVSGELTGTNIEDGAIGGIFGSGQLGSVIECTNKASITCVDDLPEGPHTYAGGIAGEMEYGSILNCINEGSVNADAIYTGGIIGRMIEENSTMTNCVNFGDVSGTYAAGGLAGLGRYLTMDQCGNKGSVEAGVYAGGLIGSTSEQTDQYSKIKNCFNHGKVSVSEWNGEYWFGEDYINYQAAAGLVGFFSKAELVNCYNNGPVISQYEGVNHASFGLVGFVNSGKEPIINCYNSGQITAGRSQDAFGIGLTPSYSMENTYTLEGLTSYTGNYTENSWITEFARPISEFRDGTVLKKLQEYKCGDNAAYEDLESLNEWVMGENGPELEWEKLLNGAGGIVEEVVQPSSTAGMSGTAGMAGNHAEVLACIKTAMEENNHLTGGDIFLAEDGTVITGHQDDYGFLQIYAQIPNVKKIAVSGSGESKFALTKDGNLYYRDTQIADNVKDIAYCTNNVNEKGFYITDEGIYQLETKWPETVPDVMIQQQPDNYIVCDNKIISQYEESNYFKNFASKDTMEGKTAISIENDLQDFAAVTSEGRVYLGRDDEIYEGMEWSSWENMIYVDIAKHMKRGSSYGEEAESITVAGLQPDGTVMACGTYAEDILSWGKLAYISMSDGMIVGLTPEGTLKITGEFAEILRPEVESWTNLVTVMAGRSNFWSGIVTAMDAEGTFYYADWGFGQELHANKVSPSNGSDSQSYYKYMTDGSVYNSTPEGWEFWE